MCERNTSTPRVSESLEWGEEEVPVVMETALIHLILLQVLPPHWMCELLRADMED